jgi:glyoxylase-like metal-dependent hydrolase (beta-lactamase superfamily II)
VDAVATHTHTDHVGSHHEFENRVVHAKEADLLTTPKPTTLNAEYWQAEMKGTGYEIGQRMLTKHPCFGYSEEDFEILPAAPTRVVEQGDVIDLGNRQFKILHLPGHSAGSMGLWEEKSGTLFSGDAVYDGPLLDGEEEGDIERYINTMRRLRELPVTVVHGGHDPSFGRKRLVELCDAYLRSKGV